MGPAMDKAERTGLGVAITGHAALFAYLWMGALVAPDPLHLKPEPIEVTLSDEVALQSASPTPDAAPPVAQSPDPAETDTPDAPTPEPIQQPQVRPQPAPPQPRAQPQPQPQPRPQPAKPQPKPKPTPAAQAKPSPEKPSPAKAAPAKAKPAPAKPAQRRGTLGSLVKGITDKPRAGPSTGTPAATIGPAQKSALASEVRRQLKPHWKAPSGADADQLRTELAISLAPDGRVLDIRFLRTTGVTDSNRAQVDLHREQAIKAVKLASPFKLPPDLYAAWKTISPISFDKRL